MKIRKSKITKPSKDMGGDILSLTAPRPGDPMTRLYANEEEDTA